MKGSRVIVRMWWVERIEPRSVSSTLQVIRRRVHGALVKPVSARFIILTHP